MPLPTVTTLEFDVTTNAVDPDVTMVRFGDGAIRFTNKDGVVRYAHSNDELAQELFALIDSILNP